MYFISFDYVLTPVGLLCPFHYFFFLLFELHNFNQHVFLPVILPSICSNMLLKGFVGDFSSVIVFFGFKICLFLFFLMFSASSLSFSFCSYIIFLVVSNCLSVFFYSSLSICRAIILNYLLGNSWISICLLWIWEAYCIPLAETCFPCSLWSLQTSVGIWEFEEAVTSTKLYGDWFWLREACHLWKGEHQIVWWPLV